MKQRAVKMHQQDSRENALAGVDGLSLEGLTEKRQLRRAVKDLPEPVQSHLSVTNESAWSITDELPRFKSASGSLATHHLPDAAALRLCRTLLWNRSNLLSETSSGRERHN